MVTTQLKNHIVNGIVYAYILLFTYAAISKLLDFENFQVQLGQSPLLSAFADLVAWGIISIELLISFLLIYNKTKTLALYIAFGLMTMFTAYIFIILNFSTYIPCSCGGVLEKMGWTEHLLFNIGFIIIAALGIFLKTEKQDPSKNRNKKISRILLVTTILSIGFITLLFTLSEDIIHHNNNFIRRFPPHPVTLKHQLDLKLNSYYISGIDKNQIYLSNVTAPLYMKVLDYELNTVEENEISLSTMNLPFRYAKVYILSPDFYFLDGSIPIIFKRKN